MAKMKKNGKPQPTGPRPESYTWMMTTDSAGKSVVHCYKANRGGQHYDLLWEPSASDFKRSVSAAPLFEMLEKTLLPRCMARGEPVPMSPWEQTLGFLVPAASDHLFVAALRAPPPPNPRVQRTRSSPSALRSPLTRRPLGR